MKFHTQTLCASNLIQGVIVILEMQQVYTLAQRFREYAFPDERDAWDIAENAWPCMQWPLTVGSLDWGARQIAETLMDFVGSTSQGSSRPFSSSTHRIAATMGHTGSRWPSPCVGSDDDDDIVGHDTRPHLLVVSPGCSRRFFRHFDMSAWC